MWPDASSLLSQVLYVFAGLDNSPIDRAYCAKTTAEAELQPSELQDTVAGLGDLVKAGAGLNLRMRFCKGFALK